QDRTSMTSDPSSPAWANHSNCPDTAADNCDPINGREWATNKSDLEFSCTFPLVTVNGGQIVAFQKDCTSPGPGDQYKGACDCAMGALNANTQLCQKGSGGYVPVQINAKAYPPVRELLIAKAMSQSTSGNQGIVSSICPIDLDIGQSVAQAQQDPLFGFNPAMNAVINRLRTAGASTCMTYDLSRYTVDAGTGELRCTTFVQLPKATTGTCKVPGSACSANGLVAPDASLLATFCDELESRYRDGGSQQGPTRDPATIPVCALPQLILDPNDTTDCSQSPAPGWCYVQGAAAQRLGCSSTIAFASNSPPNDTTAYLECLSQ
ncbi:MAG TPA: hypothetical protein VF765_26565, partial [Polyangiaceae bacterium]